MYTQATALSEVREFLESQFELVTDLRLTEVDGGHFRIVVKGRMYEEDGGEDRWGVYGSYYRRAFVEIAIV